MKTLITLCAAMLLATSVQAEVNWALTTPGARHAADIVSWGTSLAPVALDSVDCFRGTERGRCLALQGLRLGTESVSTYLAKRIFHRARPCAPVCGSTEPYTSFWSGHSAFPATAFGGPRLAFVLPFTVSTMGLRVAAGKHWPTDTLVGAAVGLATSRIR